MEMIEKLEPVFEKCSDGVARQFPPRPYDMMYKINELVEAVNRMEKQIEKQKDAFENGRQLGIMQEQARQELGWPDEKKKEHQNNSDAPEKALGRDLISPKDKDTNLDEIAQDYVDGVKEYNPEPTWDLIQTAVCYGYHYCEQKEQKPAEWSEEDDQLIGFIFDLLNSLVWRKEWAMDKKECLERLKSLRPSWKPSEEQMEALKKVTGNAVDADEYYPALATLYYDLKEQF